MSSRSSGVDDTQLLVDAHLLVAARLDRERSLSVFRTLLAALSRPGRVVQLDVAPDAPAALPPALLPVLALADLDQRVAVLGDETWGRVVAAVTGAVVVDDVAAADVVVALRPPTRDELHRVRVGTHAAPEAGARVVVACRALRAEPSPSDDSDAAAFTVRGPGAAAGRRVRAAGLDDVVVAGIRRATLDFPAGFDTWLVDDSGAVVGLPRSVEIH